MAPRAAWPLLLVTVGLAAIVAGGVWLLLAPGSSEIAAGASDATPDKPAAATTTATPTGEDSPTVTPTPGPIAVRAVVDVPFPPATSILVLRVPGGKGSGALRLDRVYRLDHGPVREDVLYEIAEAQQPAQIEGAAAAPDGSVI